MSEKKRRSSVAKSQKKVWGSKQVLASPFASTFPSAKPGTKEAVLQIIVQLFPKPFISRKTRPSRKSQDDFDSTRKYDHHDARNRKPLRMLCGINEVTRALEKNKVEVVVVSRDVTPAFLVTHVPVLCFLTSARLVVLPGDGTELGHFLGTKRLLAFGLLRKTAVHSKDTELVDLLIERLAPYSTPLDYPWLAAIKGEKVPTLPEPVMVPHKKKNDILASLHP